MDAKHTAPRQAPHELTITRIVDAPRKLVFKLWTNPKHMEHWWGPKGFTTPVCEIDLRVGGALYIVMRSPDGDDHPMKGVFREIAEPERLVFTNIALDHEGNPLLEGLTTVTFAENEGKTKLTLHTTALDVTGKAAQMLKGMEQGWSQSLDRLETLTQKLQNRGAAGN